MGSWRTWLLVLWIVLLFEFRRAAELQQSERHRRIVNQRRIRADEMKAGQPGGGAHQTGNSDICKIRNSGNHPWIIKILYAPHRDSEDPQVTAGRHLMTKYLKKPRSNAEEGFKDDEPQTLMTGTLISPTTVLSTNAYADMVETIMNTFNGTTPRQYFWMDGYNYEKHCIQRQHLKLAIYHPKRSHELGSLGDYGLYTPWEPFDVEGEPFLLQKPHPIENIQETITRLIAKPESLTMFAFWEIEEGADDNGELLSDRGSKFDFIGLPECKKMPGFLAQAHVHFDPAATDTSFFCGNGIKGAHNGSRDDEKGGRGTDLMSGSVAFYIDGNGTMLPLGLYDYWLSASGEPRFFTALTKAFFTWLDMDEFPSVTDTSVSQKSTKPLPQRQNGTTNGKLKPSDVTRSIPVQGGPSHIAEFWLLTTTALTSIIFLT